MNAAEALKLLDALNNRRPPNAARAPKARPDTDRLPHDPTPQQIAAATAAIRRDWSDVEHKRRASLNGERFTVPMIAADGIQSPV